MHPGGEPATLTTDNENIVANGCQAPYWGKDGDRREVPQVVASDGA